MTIESLNMEFIHISPGTFMMGSPESEPGRFDSEIQHQVTLSQGFYMGKTVVTVEQFRKFVIASGYETEVETDGQVYIHIWDNPGFEQTDDHPVTCVSWFDAQAFIEWLNVRVKDDLQCCLPTEAQWEYAARANTTAPFSFGDTLSKDQANFDNNHRIKTTPVGSFPANAWGLYDMHGNVWEWCQDRYGAYPSGSVTDPQGPLSGDHRVLRGGGWDDGARFCRSADRGSVLPGYRDDLGGFRLVAHRA